MITAPSPRNQAFFGSGTENASNLRSRIPVAAVETGSGARDTNSCQTDSDRSLLRRTRHVSLNPKSDSPGGAGSPTLPPSGSGLLGVRDVIGQRIASVGTLFSEESQHHVPAAPVSPSALLCSERTRLGDLPETNDRPSENDGMQFFFSSRISLLKSLRYQAPIAPRRESSRLIKPRPLL